MPRNAALLGLAGVLLAAVVTVAPTALAGDRPAPNPPPPNPPGNVEKPIKQLNGDSLTLHTVSPVSNLFGDASPEARGFLLLDRPCGEVPSEGSVVPEATTRANQEAGYGTAQSPHPSPGFATMAPRPAGPRPAGAAEPPYCVALPTTTVAKTDPAQGMVILKSTPGAPDPTTGKSEPVVSSVKYTVERSSSVPTYVLLFAIAVAAGTAIAYAIRRSLRAVLSATRVLPETYKYDDPWASAVTLVGAIGAPLLGASGLSSWFSPQYRTDGITVANLGVAALIAVGPVLVAAFYQHGDEGPPFDPYIGATNQRRRRRVLTAVGGFVVTGLTAQLLLDGLYLAMAGISGWWLALAGVVIVGAVAVLAVFVWKALVKDLP